MKIAFARNSLCLALVLSLAFAPAVRADDSKKSKAKDDGSFHGLIVRDGDHLSLRVKNVSYVLKPADDATADVKKQLDVANADTLAKSKWIVKGKATSADGTNTIAVESLTDDGPAKGKKK